MKPYLVGLVRDSKDLAHAKNQVREALQASILGSLQRAGGMIPLAFHGGTALRFLYSIRRFSEDLDFALERKDRDYDFRSLLGAIRRDMTREGYAVELKVNDRKVVHSAFVRFPGLLHELGISPHPTEILAIKLEVDTRPPAGAGLRTSLVRKHVTLQLQHHDRASLLAGKLHAVLQRSYTKGRDLYDLIWYLSDRGWPSPNLELLNNALRQSAWDGLPMTNETWREQVRSRIAGFDWQRAVDDLDPFVESPEEIDLITRENALRLLVAS